MAPLPSLHVTSYVGREKAQVLSVAPGRFIYFLLSWQGCGCGFCYESESELARDTQGFPEEMRVSTLQIRDEGRASVAALADYLRLTVQDGPVFLYVAWAGTEGQQVQHVLEVTPDYFGGEKFCLMEDTLLTVHR